ncbi:hypothetical protein CP980_28985 [Streptomyces vinaceus]|uniref:Uncharacterized protein n=1 Tax=Streptomyces vinaceus TaxID=1960 RepID=A0A5J6JCF5_STRVI|nr:DUF6002 family protein [Streptomyces vinaceus]QEV48579.1 hypothetical protein CP980_28985 [Streptomyces vinaceus]GHE35622.1 hypothetical protein GCM10017778_18170 [Streptomyces vinaceus]
MSETGHAAGSGKVVRNALDRYFEEIRTAARTVEGERTSPADIPLELTGKPAAFAAFTEVTDVGLTRVDQRTHILDLMRNPGARTTKTMASLLMIARAAAHIRRTGERIMLFTPTSGNKGTALRDAVARAHATGLATPDELRIVMLAPEASRNKLRDCALTGDQALRTANPVVLAKVERPADVKQLSSEVVQRHTAEILDTTGFRLWYTLDLDNYRIADAVRAFVEAELLPITADSAPRVHVHAVSSAFGLLGYHLGHRLLTEGLPGYAAPARHPGFHLVQQLATADMVTSLLGTKVPDYTYDATTGLWQQDAVAEFPAVTDDPREVIDPTFYTKEPPTRTQINDIVARHGGGGIVVSRRECLEHFDQVRALAAVAGIEIAADPTLIREWSLVKALTGVLLSRERGLLGPDTDVVVHGSGYYSDELVPALREDHLTRVGTVDDLARAVLAAAHA